MRVIIKRPELRGDFMDPIEMDAVPRVGDTISVTDLGWDEDAPPWRVTRVEWCPLGNGPEDRTPCVYVHVITRPG
jgi:hypothetical protein